MSAAGQPGDESPGTGSVLGGLAAVLLLLMAGLQFEPENREALLTWAARLGRLTPDGWAGTSWALAFVLAALVTLALVALVRRYRRAAQPGRWSFRAVAFGHWLVLGFVTAGVSAVGVLHGLAWFPSTRELLLADRSQWAVYDSKIHLTSQSSAVADRLTLPGRELRGCLTTPHGVPLHGWPVQLLPYLNADLVAQGRADLTKPWDDPVNAPLFRQRCQPFEHPAPEFHDPDGFGLNFYAANVHVLGGERAVRRDDLQAQGASNVLLIGEAHGNFKPWGHPIQWRDPAVGLNTSPDGFGTPLGRGSVQFLMLDGSVRTFAGTRTDPAFLEALQGSAGRRPALPGDAR